MSEIEKEKIEVVNKIDEIVNGQINDIAAKKRGFVLNLVTDKNNQAAVEVKQVAPLEHIPLAKLREHQLTDTNSFVAYCKRYGTAEKSLIFVDKSRVVMTIDDVIDRGDRENISMFFNLSPNLRVWNNVFDQKTDHKTLLRFIQKNNADLIDLDILNSFQTLKFNSKIKYDSQVTDDKESFSMVFESGGDEQIKKFKKRFSILLPILDQDFDSPDKFVELEVKLDVELPSTVSQDTAKFILSCNNLQQLIDQRIAAEAEVIRQSLGDGWLVVNGSCHTMQRTIIH